MQREAILQNVTCSTLLGSTGTQEDHGTTAAVLYRLEVGAPLSKARATRSLLAEEPRVTFLSQVSGCSSQMQMLP